MTNLLNPQNDVVFKLLFSKPENKTLLISLLEAILQPASPIEEVTILNPSLPREMVDDKAPVLDLALQLADHSRVDVEMQVGIRIHSGNECCITGRNFTSDS